MQQQTFAHTSPDGDTMMVQWKFIQRNFLSDDWWKFVYVYHPSRNPTASVKGEQSCHRKISSTLTERRHWESMQRNIYYFNKLFMRSLSLDWQRWHPLRRERTEIPKPLRFRFLLFSITGFSQPPWLMPFRSTFAPQTFTASSAASMFLAALTWSSC